MTVGKGSVTNTEKNLGQGWVTGGYQVNPGIGFILADTGPLPAGIYDFFLVLYQRVTLGTQGARLEHRNAANAATLVDQYVCSPLEAAANTYHGTVAFFWKGYEIVLNERLRWFQINAVGGDVQASIMWVRRR